MTLGDRVLICFESCDVGREEKGYYRLGERVQVRVSEGGYEIYQQQWAEKHKYKLGNQEAPCSQFRQIVPDSQRALESHAVPRPSWKSLGRGGAK